jgi:hypothetical protein
MVAWGILARNRFECISRASAQFLLYESSVVFFLCKNPLTINFTPNFSTKASKFHSFLENYDRIDELRKGILAGKKCFSWPDGLIRINSLLLKKIRTGFSKLCDFTDDKKITSILPVNGRWCNYSLFRFIFWVIKSIVCLILQSLHYLLYSKSS